MAENLFPKCLIVDDTHDYLDVILEGLKQGGISEIITLDNPTKVIETLEKASEAGEPFDMLISDNFMPGLNGSDLLKLCRAHDHLNTLPVIIMTGDPDSFSAKECLGADADAKADDYIIKPFDMLVLIRKVMAIFRLHREGKVEFSPIRSSTLCINSPVLFDIFIRSYDQYRVLVEKKDVIVKKHLDLLKQHKMKRLYISAQDETKYHKYLEANLNSLLEDRRIPSREKAGVLSDYSNNILQNSFDNPKNISFSTLDKVSSAISTFLLESQEDTLVNMISVEDNPSIHQHSLNVASICLLITTKISHLREYPDEYTNILRPFEGLFYDETSGNSVLMEAALLHDIGKTSPNYNTKLAVKADHIAIGLEMLEGLEGINSKIPEIISQHEELCDGSGGPLGLTKNKISLFAQILSLANHCEIEMSQSNCHGKELMLYLKRNAKKFNPQVIEIFLMTMDD